MDLLGGPLQFVIYYFVCVYYYCLFEVSLHKPCCNLFALIVDYREK